jgi:hypothetical protein
MRRFLVSNAVIATLLFVAAAKQAPAQTIYSRPGTPGGPDDYQSGLKLYSKTWSDLNQAQKRVAGNLPPTNPAATNPGDWYRFDQARGQMDLLERSWKDGSFNRAQINTAIDDLQFVLKFNNMSARERQALAQDLEHLRDIRLRYAK